MGGGGGNEEGCRPTPGKRRRSRGGGGNDEGCQLSAQTSEERRTDRGGCGDGDGKAYRLCHCRLRADAPTEGGA